MINNDLSMKIIADFRKHVLFQFLFLFAYLKLINFLLHRVLSKINKKKDFNLYKMFDYTYLFSTVISNDD